MICTCQKWQLYHLPCSHAIAAIKKARRRVQDYIDPCYLVEWYKKAYAPKFSTIPDQDYWSIYDGYIYFLDPQRRRKIGRPVTKRLRNEMDWVEKKDDTWCKHCQQQGHRSTKCPQKKGRGSRNTSG